MLGVCYRAMLKRCGSNVRIDPCGLYSFNTISVGDDVLLGRKPTLIAWDSEILIGSKVMLGPEVVIVGGDHNSGVIGQFLYDVCEKRPSDDARIVIEDDVWVGARAIILKGVTIGRGAIVAAGSVVVRSVPPYAIAVGAPARVVRFRWDVETTLRHEAKLWPPDKRFSRQELEQWQSESLASCGRAASQ
jgi:acetyltransferase-like isoleucine patch superfamily enzyme